jgi:uncharacterized protein YndB with AHSA1/START domain
MEEGMKKTLRFATVIDAEPSVVWNTMLAEDTYRIWTSEFAEGSYFEGSWNEGERIRFLAPGGSGITSVIAESRPNEFISIKHLGFIKNGVEDTGSDEVRSWAPSFENYSFSRAGSSTELKVALDVPLEYEESMAKTWPKALARLKAICEASSAARK